MVVAGDHANNDMAGEDEDSWKSQFEASGAFDEIDTQIEGLEELMLLSSCMYSTPRQLWTATASGRC